MDIKVYAEEVIEKLNNLSDEEFDELLEESIKFDGGLMGLTYAIYYCKECGTDFTVKSSSKVICCPSCKNEKIIRGNVQDFC